MKSKRSLLAAGMLVSLCVAGAIGQTSGPQNAPQTGEAVVQQSTPQLGGDTQGAAVPARGASSYGIGIGVAQSQQQVTRGSQLAAEDRKLEGQVNNAIAQYRATEEDEARTTIKSELRETLKKQFDVRFQQHELQIEELEAKVRPLRERLERRREKQEEIVDFRLEQLIRDADGLGWGTDSSGARSNSRRSLSYNRATGNGASSQGQQQGQGPDLQPMQGRR